MKFSPHAKLAELRSPNNWSVPHFFLSMFLQFLDFGELSSIQNRLPHLPYLELQYMLTHRSFGTGRSYEKLLLHDWPGDEALARVSDVGDGLLANTSTRKGLLLRQIRNLFRIASCYY